MPNNNTKNTQPNNNTKKTTVIGPKENNTQPFGTYASNRGGRRRKRTTKRRIRR